MDAALRTRNPFISSSAGGRTLSAIQLPFFLLRPPAGYAILTTTGRKTGKRRRRCVRAVRSGEKAYMAAIKGADATAWAKNARAAPEVQLRRPGERVAGRARQLSGEAEILEVREAYAAAVCWFDYLTWITWRRGRPTPERIKALLDRWFEEGTPLVVELDRAR